VSILRRRARHRIIIDVDTQYDKVLCDDRDRSEALRNIHRLIAWSRRNHIPVISTALSHRADELAVNENTNHICIEDTPGQRKIRYTILPSHIQFGPENIMDLPRCLLANYQQVIFAKRLDDPFTQQRFDRLICEIKSDEFIVIGIGVETAIKSTVLGLLQRGKKVKVVSDAIDAIPTREEMLAQRMMETKGAQFVKSNSIAKGSKLTRNMGNIKLTAPQSNL